jgi:hypothetical protein
MDQVRDFLIAIQQQGLAQGHFLGLLHILIGRRVTRSDGTLVSTGVTWRDLATQFKNLRWDIELAKELGIDASKLPARDRQRLWYSVIAQADVASGNAIQAGNRLAGELAKLGYIVGPAPGTTGS